MEGPVRYTLEDSIAWITMDDGKVNVMSPTMLAAIGRALDQAEKDGAVVVLRGRAAVFSAGFDLAVLRGGGDQALAMLRGGFELSERLLSFPSPVVMACNGHAVAMGVFLLLSGDYRIGVSGPYKFQANEVAIGLPMPWSAVEILRQRLTPACLQRALVLAEAFTPDNAVEAGFLDQVVELSQLEATARQVAVHLGTLDRHAHATSKLRTRRASLAAIRAGIDEEFGLALDTAPPPEV